MNALDRLLENYRVDPFLKADAVAEVATLRAENARLREALQQIADETCDHNSGPCWRDMARAALAGKDGGE